MVAGNNTTAVINTTVDINIEKALIILAVIVTIYSASLIISRYIEYRGLKLLVEKINNPGTGLVTIVLDKLEEIINILAHTGAITEMVKARKKGEQNKSKAPFKAIIGKLHSDLQKIMMLFIILIILFVSLTR